MYCLHQNCSVKSRLLMPNGNWKGINLGLKGGGFTVKNFLQIKTTGKTCDIAP